MADKFNRTRRLIGDDAVDRLSEARVIVFGIGGVGSYVCEGLVRSGVGHITLVDNDDISETNINRQLPATSKTVGMKKAEVMAERLKEINPLCDVKALNIFYIEETKNQIDLSEFDYVVDAVDTVSAKLLLVEECDRLGIRIISSMGTGNKLDATRFQISDIYKTSVCPLARVMRLELKKRGIKKLKCLWSDEQPKVPFETGEQEDAHKRHIPASISYVPSVAGLIIAGEVIKDISGI
ncbi:MAG: tRNA threonylcarbamoyladenosine dehydratase [Ruminococcus sp.]|nr:tRNA threonylcarbamoyladenosine dehydratase [Ruminococcus sp.]